MTERPASAQNSTENTPKRERLSYEELGNLLAAVGNHEAKAITLLAMRDGNLYTKSGLHKIVLNAQGESSTWNLSSRVPFSYCENSLSPIGLVTKETLNPDLSTYGYQITEYGKKFGIPLCGLLLDFSRRHNISLNLILGKTASTSILNEEKVGETEYKKRAPMTRLKIFYELLTTPDLPIREVDLEKRLEERSQYLRVHLESLSENGFIHFQTRGVNIPFSFYKLAALLPEEALPIHQGNKTLTKNVFEILHAHRDEYLTREDIWDFFPQDQKERYGKKILLAEISGVLSHLKRNNYLEMKKFNREEQSEINLASEQRTTLSELVDIIDKFQNLNPNILQRGERLANEIITNPLTISLLLRRSKEASSYANRNETSESRAIILSYVSSNPGITNREIQNLLKQRGQKLGMTGVRELTAQLTKTGSLKITQNGSVKKFFPKNSEQK